MKVFTTFIFAVENKLDVQFLFSMGKIKIGHPTYFLAVKIKVVKTFMASILLFILEKMGYEIQFQTNSKELWYQAIPNYMTSKLLPRSANISGASHPRRTYCT